MKNKIKVSIAGVLLTLLPSMAFGEIASLRGSNALNNDAKSFESKKRVIKEGGFDRAWDLQPPSIPHKIDKDKISLTGNTCMKCHSKENFEKENAPEIGESHYKDRNDKVLDKISSRRWFCNQCHAPQADTAPLVDNSF